MAVGDIVPVTGAQFGETLASASPDLLRSMLSTFIQTLMGAEADALCGARRYQRSPDRVDTRAGSYTRKLQTRAGEVELEGSVRSHAHI